MSKETIEEFAERKYNETQVDTVEELEKELRYKEHLLKSANKLIKNQSETIFVLTKQIQKMDKEIDATTKLLRTAMGKKQ